MKKLIFVFIWLMLVSCKGFYSQSQRSCATYNGTHTAKDWKKLKANQKKYPYLYKTFRHQ